MNWHYWRRKNDNILALKTQINIHKETCFLLFRIVPMNVESISSTSNAVLLISVFDCLWDMTEITKILPILNSSTSFLIDISFFGFAACIWCRQEKNTFNCGTASVQSKLQNCRVGRPWHAEHVCSLNLTSISYSYRNIRRKTLKFWKFDGKRAITPRWVIRFSSKLQGARPIGTKLGLNHHQGV
jgi:hypothetical protein